MKTSTELTAAQLAELQAQFKQKVNAFFVAREEMRAHLEALPEDRFLYTDGYDPLGKRHDFAQMKRAAMAHILSYTVLKSDDNAHPSHAEYHTGLIFDGAHKPYLFLQHHRHIVNDALQQVLPIRYYCAASGFMRPIYYRWLAEMQLPSVRVGTFARKFTFITNPCPHLTIGTWQNMTWLPVTRKLYDELSREHPEHAVFLGNNPDLLVRQLPRASCRAIIRDGLGARSTLSLTLPLMYAHSMRPKDLALCHYLWSPQKTSGRQRSSADPVPFFSERYGIYRRN